MAHVPAPEVQAELVVIAAICPDHEQKQLGCALCEETDLAYRRAMDRIARRIIQQLIDGGEWMDQL